VKKRERSGALSSGASSKVSSTLKEAQAAAAKIIDEHPELHPQTMFPLEHYRSHCSEGATVKYSRLASELRDSLTPLQSVYLCKILFRNPIVPLQELPLHWLSKSQYNALLVLGSTHYT
jgi:hypothetical protein